VTHVFHFFLSGEPAAPRQVRAVTVQDARRMRRVLRLGAGELVEVADSAGRVFTARIVGDGTVEILDVTREPQPAAALTVRLALSGPRSDTAVEKLVELGVERIGPLGADGARRDGRADRWQRIAEAAACQAKRPRIPRIDAPVAFSDTLVAGAVVLSHESPDDSLDAALQRAGRPVTLLVGPESGFSPAEHDAARAAGVPIATLGSVVLRTETAAITAAVLVLDRLGRLR
jgi:16S rRNA (uracil1498-N3)-methyltransferase